MGTGGSVCSSHKKKRIEKKKNPVRCVETNKKQKAERRTKKKKKIGKKRGRMGMGTGGRDDVDIYSFIH